MSRSTLSLIITVLLAAPTAYAATPNPNVAELARAQAQVARSAARQAEQNAQLQRDHAQLQQQLQEDHAQLQKELEEEHAALQEEMAEDADDTPASESEALAIEALEGLMAAPPQRALPLVRKVLAGNQSERVKRRAVFVLGMIDLPEAGQLLAETAQQSGGALQIEAIRALGIRGGQGHAATLQAIYRNGDARARRAVIQSFVISGDKAALVGVAKAATEPREARAAIHALAAMGAVAELRELGQNGEYAKELLQAFAIAGDLDGLLRIAKSDPKPALRVEAARSIGIIGGDQARQALRDLYRDGGDEVRSAALEGLMISGDEQGVLALYRAETNPARKRELLRTLTMIGGDAAFEAIDAAIDGKAP